MGKMLKKYKSLCSDVNFWVVFDSIYMEGENRGKMG